MKIDIPYYIRQVLREQRKVYVPGIGTFRLDHVSAYFNDDKTVISPPILNLSFDESESEDDSLLKYILDTGLTTEAKARKKIEQYTQSAFNKLLNVDSFVIDGVGKLVKKEEEDKVKFEPQISNLTREFSDLSSLNLVPIARIQEQIPASQIINTKPLEEESGSFIPRILLLALLFIGLFFIGKYFHNSFNNQQKDTQIEVPLDKGAVEDKTEEDATIGTSNTELESRYEQVDELIDPINEGKEETGGSKMTEESSTPTEDLEPKQEEKDNDIASTESPIEQPVEKAEVKTVQPVDKIDNKPPANKYADIIPETGECVIIVGSFIKSLNAIKMASLLERKGYNVFRSEYKGFTRIGIKYECENEDLEAYLKNVRKKISKRAWYLDPDLDVPL